jgi:hypothetical protein
MKKSISLELYGRSLFVESPEDSEGFAVVVFQTLFVEDSSCGVGGAIGVGNT